MGLAACNHPALISKDYKNDEEAVEPKSSSQTTGDGDDDEGERGEREDRAAGYSDRLPLVGHRLLSHAQSGSVNFTLALYHIHGNSCRVAGERWREYNFSRSR